MMIKFGMTNSTVLHTFSYAIVCIIIDLYCFKLILIYNLIIRNNYVPIRHVNLIILFLNYIMLFRTNIIFSQESNTTNDLFYIKNHTRDSNLHIIMLYFKETARAYIVTIILYTLKRFKSFRIKTERAIPENVSSYLESF